MMHRLWAWLNLAVSAWALGAFFASITPNKALALSIYKWAMCSAVFIPVIFFHFVYILSSIPRRKIIIIAYISAAVFNVLNLTTGFFVPRVDIAFGSFYYPRVTLLFSFALFFWVALVVMGNLELIRLYQKVNKAERNKIAYLLAGFFIAFIGASTYFFPMYGIAVYPVGSIAISIYTVIVTYAILKYQILDIKIAVTRAGLFLVTYTLVLGLSFVVATAFQKQFMDLLGQNWLVIPFGLTIILATLGPYFYAFLQESAERRLLRGQKMYRDVLRHASIGITRINDLSKLLNFITHVINKAVRVSYVAIYLEDKENKRYVLKASRYKNISSSPEISYQNSLIPRLFRGYNPISYEGIKKEADISGNWEAVDLARRMALRKISLVIPLFLENRLLGFIFLGERSSLQPYSQEDMSVFNILANQAALAVENSLFYEKTRKMQEQVVKAVNMSKALIETSINGFIYLDLSGRILDINSALCDLTGYTREELLKMRINDLEALQREEEIRSNIETLPDKGFDVLETRYRRKDGVLLDVEVNAHYMNEYNGGILIFVRDLTSQKKVEQSLRLAQLGELVSGIAHEIRNPLMIISGKAQLALMEPGVNGEVKEGLNIILDQCSRSSSIINRLLKFARPSRESIQDIRINVSLDSLLELLEYQYSLRNIKISRDYAKSLPLVRIDEKEIQEVIMNLLHNAADAMPEGGTITIATSRDRESVRVSVSDTGCGISNENLRKLFTPFFTTKETGTGLGLSVCYGLIKAHGGELKCESKLGQGTRFTIVLPIEGGEGKVV